MNNKGQLGSMWGIIFLVGGLMVLLFIGLLMAGGVSVLNWTMDIVVPEFSSLGMVGDTNMTQISDITLNPVHSLTKGFKWLGGVVYFIGVLAIFALAFIYRATMQKWLMPFFFGLMIILLIVSIFMSNIYEDLYRGTDELASGLKEQDLLSWMILYSPAIFSIVGFIAGAIMFSGAGTEEATA